MNFLREKFIDILKFRLAFYSWGKREKSEEDGLQQESTFKKEARSMHAKQMKGYWQCQVKSSIYSTKQFYWGMTLKSPNDTYICDICLGDWRPPDGAEALPDAPHHSAEHPQKGRQLW